MPAGPSPRVVRKSLAINEEVGMSYRPKCDGSIRQNDSRNSTAATELSTTTSLYTHQPLTTPLSIRIAELQPGEHDSPLVVKLGETLLPSGRKQQAEEKYQTVSYECGEPIRTRPVEVLNSDGVLLITTNLEKALQYIRSKDETLKLWIDALCIADDIAERNSQVGMMHLIFKSATRVFMWIGDDVPTTPLALSMLENLDTLGRQIKERALALDPAMKESDLTFASQRALQVFLEERELPLDLKDTEGWNAVSELMSRTYFERTWIAQEILLSWNATVVCGTHRFRWQLLRDAVLCCMVRCTFLPTSGNHSLAASQLAVLATFHDWTWRGRQLNIIDVLQQLRWSRCTDPRDYVYGTSGIAKYPHGAVGHSDPVDIGLPPPDYAKPIEELLRETTEALIKHTGDLRVLFNIQLPRLRAHASLPSWVIDWTGGKAGWYNEYLQPGETLDLHDVRFLRPDMCMPVQHAPRPLFPGVISIDDSLLVAGGFSLGVVTDRLGALHQKGVLSYVAKIFTRLEESYENTFFDKYVDGKSILSAFISTLFMGTEDQEAASRGCGALDQGLFTPMIDSFLGALALEKTMEQVKTEFPKALHASIQLDAIERLGAGLFLASSRSIGDNSLFFRTSTGLMGRTNLDIEPGDSIVMLHGALAPLVLRHREGDCREWKIVGDAYVHGAMERNDYVYTEDVLRNIQQFRIG